VATPGTITFLFTDIEGSTRLVAQLRDVYGDLLEQHRTILRDAAAHHDGEEVDTQGDAFFFSFHRAQDAVLAAADAQRALAAHSWPDGAQVRVRMGIHTGEPGRSVTGYHGLGIVRAARISAAGHGGQVLVSQATRSLVEDEQLPGLEFDDLGEHRLKDLDRPERLFQLTIEGLPHEFPPPRGVDSQTVKQEFVTRHRRRARLVVASALGAVALAAALAFVLTRGSSITVAANSLAAIDPRSNRVVADVPVGQQPGRVEVGNGGAWVLNINDHTVSRVDPRTRTADRPVPIDGTPADLAVGNGRVWVATLEGKLIRIDPSANRVDRTTRFGGQRPGGVAITFGDGAVWVTTPGYELDRIDALTGKASVVTRGPATSFDQSAVAFGAGFVWAGYATNNRLAKMDPNTLKVVDSTTVDQGTSPSVAVGAGAVWVTANMTNTLSQINPAGLSLQKVTSTGSSPVAVAVGSGAVWVANQGDGTVSRVDSASGRVTKTIYVGGILNGIAVGDGFVWVSVD